MDCCVAELVSDSQTYNTFVLDGACTAQFTVATGQTIVAGSVLSIDGSDELVFDNSDPFAIAPFDIDTTGGAAIFAVYRGGKFNEDLLTIAAAGTPDDVRVALSRVGINLEKVYG